MHLILEARRPIAMMAATVAMLLPIPAQAGHYEPPVRMSFHDCREHVGSFLVPRETVAEHMASGFRFSYFPPELANLDPAERLANVIVVSVLCAERIVDSERTEPEPDVIAIVVVEPPATLARSGADFHAVGIYSAVDRGEVVFEENTVGSLRTGSDSVRDGEATLDLDTSAGGEVDAAAGAWRLFRTHAGEVVDAADIDASAAVDTEPGIGVLRSQGIPGLPESAVGFSIHEWDLDVEITPVEVGN